MGCHRWEPPSKPMVGCRGSLFPGLRLESADSAAPRSGGVNPSQGLFFVLGTDYRLVLACSSRLVTQSRKLCTRWKVAGTVVATERLARLEADRAIDRLPMARLASASCTAFRE